MQFQPLSENKIKPSEYTIRARKDLYTIVDCVRKVKRGVFSSVFSVQTDHIYCSGSQILTVNPPKIWKIMWASCWPMQPCIVLIPKQCSSYKRGKSLKK